MSGAPKLHLSSTSEPTETLCTRPLRNVPRYTGSREYFFSRTRTQRCRRCNKKAVHDPVTAFVVDPRVVEAITIEERNHQ